jgi:hypothetical protein
MYLREWNVKPQSIVLEYGIASVVHTLHTMLFYAIFTYPVLQVFFPENSRFFTGLLFKVTVVKFRLSLSVSMARFITAGAFDLKHCTKYICTHTVFVILSHMMQRVQNATARFISKTRKRDQISPVLRHLHWLPVQSRVEHYPWDHTGSGTNLSPATCEPS